MANKERRTNGLRWGFEPICKVLQISPSTVRSHVARPVCARKLADEVLGERIAVIHVENYQVYGVRKVRAVLARDNVTVSSNRVGRLMRERGLRGATRGPRKVFTTHADPKAGRSPDLLNRDFTAPAPNRVWVSDFERHEAFLNLAVVKGHRHVLVAAGALKLRAA